MLCASFVVQSSTGTSYTLHTLHSTLYTPHSLLSTPHSTLNTFHSTLQTGNRGNMYCPSSDVFHACLCALVVSLWTVDQVPSLRQYARTMHEKKSSFSYCRGVHVVVQEREYIWVRGFHLVVWKKIWPNAEKKIRHGLVCLGNREIVQGKCWL